MPVKKAKETGLLAKNALSVFKILIWIFDFGSEKLPGLTRNEPRGLFLESPDNVSAPKSCFIPEKLFHLRRVCIQDQGSNNFENDIRINLSVNEAKLTGLWARNSAAIQPVLTIKFASGSEKFPGPSRNEPQELKTKHSLGGNHRNHSSTNQPATSQWRRSMECLPIRGWEEWKQRPANSSHDSPVTQWSSIWISNQMVIGSGRSRREDPSPPPLSQGLDSALIGLTPVGGTRIFSSEPPVSLTEKSSFSFFHQALNSLSILNQIFLLFFSGSWHHSGWYHLGSISSWTPSSHTTKSSWWSRQFFWWVQFFFFS